MILPAEVQALIEALRSEIFTLRSEVADLRRENEGLRAETPSFGAGWIWTARRAASRLRATG